MWKRWMMVLSMAMLVFAVMSTSLSRDAQATVVCGPGPLPLVTGAGGTLLGALVSPLVWMGADGGEVMDYGLGVGAGLLGGGVAAGAGAYWALQNDSCSDEAMLLSMAVPALAGLVGASLGSLLYFTLLQEDEPEQPVRRAGLSLSPVLGEGLAVQGARAGFWMAF